MRWWLFKFLLLRKSYLKFWLSSMKMLTNYKSHYSNPFQRYTVDAAYRKLPVQKVLIWLLWPSNNIIHLVTQSLYKGSATLRNKVFWLYSPTWRRDKRWAKLRYYTTWIIFRKEPAFCCCRLRWVHFPWQLGQANCNGETKGNKN